MKTFKGTVLAISAMAMVLGVMPLTAEDMPRIPGAGGGSSSSSAESVIEGSLEKYDSVLNKLTIRGIDEDKMVLDTVRSLKAKDGTRRIPMGMVKQGQKIRVFYVQKDEKRIAKDVEVVHDAPEVEKSSTEMPGSKDENTPVDIPGAK